MVTLLQLLMWVEEEVDLRKSLALLAFNRIASVACTDQTRIHVAAISLRVSTSKVVQSFLTLDFRTFILNTICQKKSRKRKTATRKILRMRKMKNQWRRKLKMRSITLTRLSTSLTQMAT